LHGIEQPLRSEKLTTSAVTTRTHEVNEIVRYFVKKGQPYS